MLSRTFRRSFVLPAIALLIAACPLTAFADCSTPAGSEGVLRYDTTTKTLLFCDGTTWKTLGSGGSCTSSGPLINATNISLLLKGITGKTNNNAFVDSSPNAIGITRYGDTTQGTFSPYATGYSAFFDGNGDSLTASSNAALALGTGDFTMEFWIQPAAPTATGNNYFQIIDGRDSNSAVFPIITLHSDKMEFGYPGGEGAIVSTNTLPLSVWTHVAIVRAGGQAKLYINGTLNGSVADTNSLVATPVSIGRYVGGNTSFFNGYLSNLRISKVARYSGNFSVPTASFTSDSNTVLLPKFDNAGVSDAGNKNDIETNGSSASDSSVTKFGNNSISFNGSTDSLFIPPSPLQVMDIGDFTVESWVYLKGKTANEVIVDKGGVSGTSYANYRLGLDPSGSAFYFTAGQTTNSGCCGTIGATLTGTTNPSLNTWYHVAVSKAGSTYRLFVNGNLESTATSIVVPSDTANRALTIGFEPGQSSSWRLNGNLFDLRITKGVAVYTANFTPPSAAF